jgi:hypothetical protein
MECDKEEREKKISFILAFLLALLLATLITFLVLFFFFYGGFSLVPNDVGGLTGVVLSWFFAE